MVEGEKTKETKQKKKKKRKKKEKNERKEVRKKEKRRKKKEIANQNERKAMTTSARPGVHLTCHVKLEAVGVVHLTELVKWEPPGCPFDSHCQMGVDRGGKPFDSPCQMGAGWECI